MNEDEQLTKNEQTSKLQELQIHLMQYIACLQWSVGPNPANPSSQELAFKEYNASGFLLTIQNEWFFLTASHIFNHVVNARKKGWLISGWALDDTAATATSVPVPFDFDNAVKSYFNNESDGMDIALIHIASRYHKYMHSVGKRPLSEATWRDIKENDVMAYWMLGTPEELLIRNDEGRITHKTDAVVKVKPTEKIPSGKTRNNSFFFAEIEATLGSNEAPLKDIEGMSGCPIFVLYLPHDGQMEYRIYALQSAWYKDPQIIKASRLEVFAQLVDERITTGELKLPQH